MKQAEKIDENVSISLYNNLGEIDLLFNGYLNKTLSLIYLIIQNYIFHRNEIKK